LGDTVADTPVPEAVTGFHINPITREALESTFARVLIAWKDKAQWRRLQQNGMRKDVSWEKSAAQYASLYAGLLEAKN
jgi:starch synthase